jgi:hypothetical protein
MTGTIAGFTSTGIEDNATSTKVTVSDIGINVAGTMNASAETLTGLLNLSGVNYIHQLSGHNFVQGDSTRTYLYGGTDGGQIRSADNSTRLLGWDNSGNVGIGTSSPAAKLDVVGQVRASTGILFGTDTAAANALDDYEEGTWTPTTNSGWGALTFDGVGSYTKIGNIVHISVHILIDGSGTGSGDTTIGGLPFTPNTTDDFRPAISVYAEKLNTSISTYISGLVDTAALIYIREGGRTDSGSDLGVHFDGGSGIFLQATYTAT